MNEEAPVTGLLRRVLDLCDDDIELAHGVLARIWNECDPVDRASLAYDWNGFWARPAQRLPLNRKWRRAFFKCGRSFGKTRAVVEFLLWAIQHAGVRRIAVVAQDEKSGVAIWRDGPSGFLDCAPPWMEAYSVGNKILFRNVKGASIHMLSAQEPNTIRGVAFEIAAATEIASWPVSVAAEAMMNVEIVAREGDTGVNIIVDSTPVRGNDLVRQMLAECKADPEHCLLIEGSTKDNRLNLAPGYVDPLYAKLGGSNKGAEELDGVFFDGDGSDSIFRAEWITQGRREWQGVRVVHRVLMIDPAHSGSKRSDRTGIIDAALGEDGIIYILGDYTNKFAHPNDWAESMVAHFVQHGMSLMGIENNKLGYYADGPVRAACEKLGITFSKLDAKTTGVPVARKNVVQLREHTTVKGTKAQRGADAAVHFQKLRVSFVGAGLDQLERDCVSFTGADNRPDDNVDALISAVCLLGSLELSAKAQAARDTAFTELNQIAGKIFKARDVSSVGVRGPGATVHPRGGRSGW